MQKQVKQPGITLLLAGLAIITLYFSTTLEDPFNTPKMILLFLLSAWIFGHLINSYKKFGFKLNREETTLNLIILVIVISMLMSSYLAHMPLIAFFGDIQRRNGFFTYLSLIILFLFTYRSSSDQIIIKFYKTTILIGLIMSFYGVIQISGNDFVDWVNPNNSMISTLGNPNFASAMLAIIVIISIASFPLNLSLSYKLLVVLIVPCAIYSIIKSNSLQGLLVIYVGLGFYFSLLFVSKTNKFSFRLVIFSPYLIISCLAAAGMLQKGPLASYLYKDSVSVRGFYWRAAIEMLKNNFWFGVGSDRYGAFFKQYREVGYPSRYGFDITSSNAHNVFLQLFATNGVIVGMLYLVLMGLVFTAGLRKFLMSTPTQGKFLLGLISAWLGFQAQALISIDQIGLSIWGWILSGLILGISHRRYESNISSKHGSRYPNQIKTVEFNIFQTIISTLVVIPVVWISYHLYNSERDTWFARSEFSNLNSTNLIEYSEKVLNNPLSTPTNKTKVASYLIEKRYTELGFSALKNIYAADARDLDALRVTASVLKMENKSAAEIQIRLIVAKLDPFDAPNYVRLCELYIGEDMLVDAKKMRDKVSEIIPNSNLAKFATTLVGEN